MVLNPEYITYLLYDSPNTRLNNWVLSHLDANVSDSTASANNMGGITDLGIAAFMRHCPIVSTFSSEQMKKLKKRQRWVGIQPILTLSIDE